ncbi:MAG: endonuclease III [Bacteroidales bacterium]|jgi:endonuclease-3|nr:endonuclease III [Bacteroidales bacterium]
MTAKERYDGIFDWFAKNKPTVQTELNYRTPFELLVAVMLSAQCTDKRVNMVTPELFKKFGAPARLASAAREDVFELIRSVSYPNSKSEHLISMAQELMSLHNGEVPSTMEQLVALSGVGRKTANVILSIVFGQNTLAVDTHVFRVSARLGLTRNARTPYEAEMQLIKHISPDKLYNAHHWLILHGRYVCTARNPHCNECGLQTWCKQYSSR